jgi:LPS export ABC transporter protein LptC|tara:strand:+ start:173 stop:796 length:624 start_codon:yes stop_codon:yes gene_type:complete
MNNIYRLIIFLPLFILGCAPNVIDENKVIQKIDNLDMVIYSEKGDKIYSIISPNSTYDKITLNFNLKKTTINIFEGEDIKYIINSDSSKLTNSNKIVELNGNVQLRSLNQENDSLKGDNLIWNINESKYEFIGNVRFENKNIKLNSSKAVLGKDNIIEFFNPVKYLIKSKNNDNQYEINSENAYYNIKNDSVSFKAKEKRVRSIIYF